MKISFETDRERYLWIAAWIDAEGYLTLRKKKNQWLPFIAVRNTNKFPLDILQELTSGKVFFFRIKDERRKDIYTLYLSPNKCRKWLPKIKDFLVIKHKQAELMLTALELLKDNQRWSGGNKSQYAYKIQANDLRLQAIYEQIKFLNRVGKTQDVRKDRHREPLNTSRWRHLNC